MFSKAPGKVDLDALERSLNETREAFPKLNRPSDLVLASTVLGCSQWKLTGICKTLGVDKGSLVAWAMEVVRS